ncbi:hypothetical protein HELRODRAFT_179629 [Helobdella robusta]|uniref:Uncharacterized protein n=1 Tax=Helobdella robusta TaxID=6412 RepID=T1FEY7_HELRO|nr:hypothetical protein HELRODRAFT_179629 [Helobdella robusta]ESN95284.1 hypothetical protein HELRODRAFT_179629 [Helobdella robusta]
MYNFSSQRVSIPISISVWIPVSIPVWTSFSIPVLIPVSIPVLKPVSILVLIPVSIRTAITPVIFGIWYFKRLLIAAETAYANYEANKEVKMSYPKAKNLSVEFQLEDARHTAFKQFVNYQNSTVHVPTNVFDEYLILGSKCGDFI